MKSQKNRVRHAFDPDRELTDSRFVLGVDSTGQLNMFPDMFADEDTSNAVIMERALGPIKGPELDSVDNCNRHGRPRTCRHVRARSVLDK